MKHLLHKTKLQLIDAVHFQISVPFYKTGVKADLNLPIKKAISKRQPFQIKNLF